jgi:hypothetical protein
MMMMMVMVMVVIEIWRWDTEEAREGSRADYIAIEEHCSMANMKEAARTESHVVNSLSAPTSKWLLFTRTGNMG